MHRLSGVDADMVYGETPAWHMHVGGLMVLDPSSTPDGFDFDIARRVLGSLAAELAPMRERLVKVPLGLDRPVWVEDPAFDIDAHLHHIALPAPGGPRQLATLAGTLASVKLDRCRPLWEMWFIEGLEHGHVALLTKIHHACADGVGAALLMSRLLRNEPMPAPPEPQLVSEGEPIPSVIRLLAEATGRLTTLPFRTARTLGRTAMSMRKLMSQQRSADGVSPALPFQAPRTSLNHPVTSRRSVAFTTVPLADVKAVKDALGAKVNDVVLALCAGAIRRYLIANGELPDVPLVAAVPVSVRTQDAIASLGNMVSGWFANLATDVADPVKRLLAVRDAARSAKQLYESGIEDLVMDWADLPPPALWAAGVRLYAWSHLSARVPPIFNLLVSNVPGPAMTLYAGGTRVVAVYPFGPVLDTVGLNITVLSYGDSMDFGLVTCPELVPDVWRLADGIKESLAELVKVTQAVSGGTRTALGPVDDSKPRQKGHAHPAGRPRTGSHPIWP